jgi:hypothetical protein
MEFAVTKYKNVKIYEYDLGGHRAAVQSAISVFLLVSATLCT